LAQQLGLTQHEAFVFFLVVQQAAGAFLLAFGVLAVARALPKNVVTRNRAGIITFNMTCLLFESTKV
jgi:hypothetical protein